MAKFFQSVKKLPWTADGSTGSLIDLSLIPKVLDGQPVYLEKLDLKVKLTLTNNDANNDVLLDGFGDLERKAIKRVRLTPTWTGFDTINVTGLELLRIYRASHRGLRWEGATEWDKVAKAGGTLPMEVSIPIDFRSPYGRRSRDTVLPVALLSNAEFVVDFGTFGAALVVSAASFEVIATCSTRGSKEIGVPSLLVLASQRFAADTIQPVLARYKGNITHATIARENGQMAGTDFTTLGYRVGSRLVSDDSCPIDAFYLDFNDGARSLGGKDVDNHVGTGASHLDDFIPLIGDNVGLEGQRLTATISANADQRMLTDAASTAWMMTHRRVEHRGDWLAAAARVLGIDPAALDTQSASHKPLNPGANSARSVLPRKARRRAQA